MGTETIGKIQRIFSHLKRAFAETAFILKQAAQSTFLREIDENISIIKSRQGSDEYNDLFQCHLDVSTSANILCDMEEIRLLFGHALSRHPVVGVGNGCSNENKRPRHRPHQIKKDLRDLIERSQYIAFRDSLRGIHSRFHKNCLDIYCDHLNKTLSHCDANSVFTIGSVSCLDIRPCQYLSPSWKQQNGNEKQTKCADADAQKNAMDESMLYLENIIKQQYEIKNKQTHAQPKQHPNAYLHTECDDEKHEQSPKQKQNKSPSQLLMASNYNN